MHLVHLVRVVWLTRVSGGAFLDKARNHPNSPENLVAGMTLTFFLFCNERFHHICWCVRALQPSCSNECISEPIGGNG